MIYFPKAGTPVIAMVKYYLRWVEKREPFTRTGNLLNSIQKMKVAKKFWSDWELNGGRQDDACIVLAGSNRLKKHLP